MQQLKEILAKQAELGVEVAEIPGVSLSDLKKQGLGREKNRSQFSKKGRLQNKFDKRGRYNKNDRPAKKQRLHDSASSDVSSLSLRKETLLQKLLSPDIRRDKNSLLQVFRFMVMNSFLKDWPNKPLKFPSIMVRELKRENEVVEGMPLPMKKDVYECSNKTSIMNDDNDNDGYDDNSCGKGDGCEENDGKEEGEIIN